MRKHIELYYKTFDQNNLSEMDRKIYECFNDYGYNFESTRKRTISLDSIASKSGPNCLQKHVIKGKR